MQTPWTSLVWFVVVAAAIPLALWLFKRSSLGAGLAGGAGAVAGLPRTVAVLPLSAQHRVVTVEVGSGEDRRWLVLGVSPQGLTRLHAGRPGDTGAAAPPAPGAPAAAAFQQLLRRMHPRGDDDAKR